MVKNIYVRLQPSHIHGVGVFAIRDIPKNLIIFPSNCTWKKVKKSKLKKLSEPEQRYYSDFFVIEKDYIFLPSFHPQYIDISFYINHDSKNPNVIYSDETGDFSSIQDIKIGDELFYDYSSVENANIL